MSKRGKRKLSRRRFSIGLWPAVLAALVFAGAIALWMARQAGPPPAIQRFAAAEADPVVFGRYAGSGSCAECHPREHELWSKSHHALAERRIDLERDREAFEPARNLVHGATETQFALRENRCEMAAFSAGKPAATNALERVLGVSPLRQFLVPFPGGRWQMTQAAFDPEKREWFDVFGDDRAPGEWGHWTGRGMNWNSMCAGCHNTRARKNYDPSSDGYATRLAEMAVGCEACHGPMKAHVDGRRRNAGPRADPAPTRLSKDQMLSVCGSCHARRSELTGDFKPGDSFFDHYALSIPEESDLFYADGQVREEDFEFTSFLSSKMHAAGVRCGDCHEPHSGKTLASGNALCMRCHAGVSPAPKIDPAAHSRHSENSAGNQCVECHMPVTVYMQRHPRRDHGFTLPDPWLTKEHSIPNACNRCHGGQSVDWALHHFNEWYGAGKDRPARKRAQTIARARAGHIDAAPELLKLAAEEKIPLWRAAAAILLKRWNHEPRVARALAERCEDPDPLVRAMAARALEPVTVESSSRAREAVEALARDATRLVRIEAAWALRASLDTNTPAALELLHWLEYNRDQPGGLLQWAIYLDDRGHPDEALDALRKAISWDGHSAPIRQLLAIALSRRGHVSEAAEHLKQACELAPRDASCRYHLALALNELGQLDQAVLSLEKAVALDPAFSLGWYNLGLGYSAQGQAVRALEALRQAELQDPSSARIPYARATILARAGSIEEAVRAAERALILEPNHAEAAELLRSLRRPGAAR